MVNDENFLKLKQTVDTLITYKEKGVDVSGADYPVYIKEIKRYWQLLRVEELDAVKLFIFKQNMFEMTPSERSVVLGSFGIQLTDKDKKKGITGAMERLYRHYHKPTVRARVEQIVASLVREAAVALRKEETMADALAELSLVSILFTALNDQRSDWMDDLIKHAPLEYVKLQIDLLTFASDVPSDVFSFKKTQDTAPSNLLDDERNDGEKDREIAKLTEQVRLLQKEKEDIQRELDSFLEEATKEVTTLQEECNICHDVVMQLNDKVEQQALVIRTLKRETDGQKEEPILDLRGAVVAFIGGEKVRHFQKVVHKYNGKMNFVSETDLTLVDGAVSRADVVFFMHGFAGHSLYYKTKEAAAKYDVPFEYVNTTGVSGFERQLKNFIVQTI
ncbi:hypothetical protein AWH48_03580 [Domibacillus aminovorans]|uniref:DUF2325 domain-containing protein n=1 Tax=Domibacillus aminovorans TaxID=29332 RepID=A0A177KRN2_9BACI|nr:DUF2325 domain-containing protein [Domibacillus aminovorans]OAH55767.1 hypothetical protein AWH48_03580 [Domibacillus aminovorans]